MQQKKARNPPMDEGQAERVPGWCDEGMVVLRWADSLLRCQGKNCDGARYLGLSAG